MLIVATTITTMIRIMIITIATKHMIINKPKMTINMVLTATLVLLRRLVFLDCAAWQLFVIGEPCHGYTISSICFSRLMKKRPYESDVQRRSMSPLNANYVKQQTSSRTPCRNVVEEAREARRRFFGNQDGGLEDTDLALQTALRLSCLTGWKDNP